MNPKQQLIALMGIVLIVLTYVEYYKGYLDPMILNGSTTTTTSTTNTTSTTKTKGSLGGSIGTQILDHVGSSAVHALGGFP